jgi:hypothetical protein
MNPRILVSDKADPRTVLAVFGNLSSNHVLRMLFDLTGGFIERAGLQANVVAVHTPKRYGRYQVFTERLRRVMARSDISGFALAHVPQPETDASRFGWIEGETTTDGFTITGRTSFFPPTYEAAVCLASQIAQVFPFTYGYQYVIDTAYGPGFHAIGMFYSSLKRKDVPPLPEPERRRTSSWCNNRIEGVPHGVLRDVFPVNLLTDVHRRRLIDGIPLFNWIAQDNSRGRIEQLTPAIWAWHVPDDRCAELGDTLEAAGLFASSGDA